MSDDEDELEPWQEPGSAADRAELYQRMGREMSGRRAGTPPPEEQVFAITAMTIAALDGAARIHALHKKLATDADLAMTLSRLSITGYLSMEYAIQRQAGS